MRRPELNKVPLAGALAFLHKPGTRRCFITMSVGQWDKLLEGWSREGMDPTGTRPQGETCRRLQAA